MELVVVFSAVSAHSALNVVFVKALSLKPEA